MEPIKAVVGGIGSVVGGILSPVTSLLGGKPEEPKSPAQIMYPSMPAPTPPTPSFYQPQQAQQNASILAQRGRLANATIATSSRGDLSTPTQGRKTLLGQ